MIVFFKNQFQISETLIIFFVNRGLLDILHYCKVNMTVRDRGGGKIMASFAKGVAQFVTKCDRGGRRVRKSFT